MLQYATTPRLCVGRLKLPFCIVCVCLARAQRLTTSTACKPETLNESNGAFYKPGSLAPLSDDEIVKHEETTDLYDQMQVAIREIIYRTVDKTMFLQIKNEKDAASVWRKVASIHADRGSLYEANLLVQLQNTRYNEKERDRKSVV